MSRNHPKPDRNSHHAQTDRRERELAALQEELHCKGGEPPTCLTAEPFVDWAKEHRRARLEQKRRHKAKRLGNAGTSQP